MFKLKIKEDIENLKKNYKIIILLFLTIYLYSVLTNLVYYLHKQEEILKDLFFEVLPYKNVGIISDILTSLYLLYGIIFTLFPYFYKTEVLTTDIILVISKTFILSTFLRCTSFIFTILPSPAGHCRINSKIYNPPNKYEIFTRFDMFSGCGDLIFSGHTNIITIISLTTLYYLYPILSKNKYIIYLLFVILFHLLLFVLIIMARNHYSVDIIVSTYVTILVFYIIINNFKFINTNIQDIKNNNEKDIKNIDNNFIIEIN